MSSQSPISPLPNRPAPDFTYPAGHLVAIVETPRQLASLVSDLTCNGFQTGEIRVLDCRDAAALGATTGHSGVVAWLIRLADRLGVRDDEAEVKGRYAQELREGHYSVKVRARDTERITRALGVLQAHGARFVNLFTRFTIQRLAA